MLLRSEAVATGSRSKAGVQRGLPKITPISDSKIVETGVIFPRRPPEKCINFNRNEKITKLIDFCGARPEGKQSAPHGSPLIKNLRFFLEVFILRISPLDENLCLAKRRPAIQLWNFYVLWIRRGRKRTKKYSPLEDNPRRKEFCHGLRAEWLKNDTL